MEMGESAEECAPVERPDYNLSPQEGLDWYPVAETLIPA